jgi:hypothetical protein
VSSSASETSHKVDTTLLFAVIRRINEAGWMIIDTDMAEAD